jgi:hypothetical protein
MIINHWGWWSADKDDKVCSGWIYHLRQMIFWKISSCSQSSLPDDIPYWTIIIHDGRKSFTLVHWDSFTSLTIEKLIFFSFQSEKIISQAGKLSFSNRRWISCAIYAAYEFQNEIFWVWGASQTCLTLRIPSSKVFQFVKEICILSMTSMNWAQAGAIYVNMPYAKVESTY